jgi:hypothetical protein
MKLKIEKIKRYADNDLVFEVRFNVIAKEGGLIANKRGKVTLEGDPDSPDFIPFSELKEDDVNAWIRAEVDVDAIETEVQQILEEKKSKTGTVILSSSLNKI